MYNIFNNVNLGLKDPKQDHQFWDTQPIINILKHGSKDLIDENGPVEKKTVDQVQKECYQLPNDYEWYTPNFESGDDINKVHEFLSKYYVENLDGKFRFNYSIEVLKWALLPPNYIKDWNIIMKFKNNIVGFISMIPSNVRIYGKDIISGRVNFLCVHKGLRNKKMAQILIKEITRRSNIKDCWQALYTSGTILPNPFANCTYYHRYIDVKKLVSTGFTFVKNSMKSMLKLYQIPNKSSVKLRPLMKEDISQVIDILTIYLSKFHLSQVFTKEEFEHWFITKENVVYSYVVEDKGIITDFISFYTITTQIIGDDKYKELKVAYSFYNVSTRTGWDELMSEALIICKQLGFDVFNCLDIMDNNKFLKSLKFVEGNGKLKYYLYNWKCPITKPEGVGLVLI